MPITREFNTPMMRQYAAIKQQYDDCLLLFRLGDFYELFLEDAIIGAQTLNITLTKRPRGKDGHIPMAGVPYHAADSYIAKLVAAGHKVAICEQVSEPDAKGIVERDVVRIVTPGTVMDQNSLEDREHNYTMSIALGGEGLEVLGVAVADVSTGDFVTTEFVHSTGSGQASMEQTLANELARFNPAECIVNDETYDNPRVLSILNGHQGLNIYPYQAWDEHGDDAVNVLERHFGVATLRGLGFEGRGKGKDMDHALRAAASLLGYLRHTQKDKIDHVRSLRNYAPHEHMMLDRSTMVNLELFKTLRTGEKHGSLINTIDHTVTAMGGRTLRKWLRSPLTNKDDIQARLDSVEELVDNRSVRDSLRSAMDGMYDIERLLSRLSVGIGNARDLVNLKIALEHTQDVRSMLTAMRSPLLKQLCKGLPTDIDMVQEIISSRIVDEPPIDTKVGGMIRGGYDKKLDDLRSSIGGNKDWLVEMEAKERKRSGIGSLKIKYNQVFGYYIEISKANLKSVPDNYVRKQTMVNAERFITPELKEYEEKVLTAQEQIQDIELMLFERTVAEVLKHTDALQQTANDIATIDCLATFAYNAQQFKYSKPTLRNDGVLEITDGRHPVVEQLIEEQFVPNDTGLGVQGQGDEGRDLHILTGPNMAGKSVYMRQVALITLMAHMGSYVPASKADIPLVDRIFVRSGAADVITSGMSTFMVEMVETAYILNHATDKSLIIMDEIGRGTSTYDGISIAWAVAEHIVQKIGAKTLFATHYHELQDLEQQYADKIANYQMMVDGTDHEPVFLHKVSLGGASHSYGVAVAKLAGVPDQVTKRAQDILRKLEKKR